MLRVAAYCRVSTEKEQQLDSLEKQKEFFSEFAKQNNYQLVYIYADEGITGRQTKKREQFNQMMRDAKKGMFDLIAVKDITRFARNTVDLLVNVRELKSINVEVQFVSNSYKTLGNSEFILTVYGAIAQEESAGLSKKVKFGKDITAKKGRVPNFVFGYNKIENEKYTLQINEEEAKIVKEIFDLYVNKRYGNAKIAKILNNRGLRTKRSGALYQPENVGRILSHKIYIGDVENKKSQVVDFLTGRREKIPEEEHIIVHNESLRIIPDELFYKAQEIKAENLVKTRQNFIKSKASNKFIFSTLIKCEHCGYSFFREERQYKNHFIRWKCLGKKNLGRIFCDNDMAIEEEELVDAIKKYFEGIVSNKKDFINKTINKYNRIMQENNKDIKTDKELNKNLEKLKATKKKYIDMYASDMIDDEEYKELTDNINIKIKDIKAQMQMLKFTMADEETLNKDIKDKMQEIENILNGNEFTNEGLKKIIDVINVNKNGNVEIILKGITNFSYDNEIIVRDIVEESQKLSKKSEIVELSEQIDKISTLDNSVHKDLSERIIKINPALSAEVRLVLDENKAERHIRGGMATKLKYSHIKEKTN
ncbi:MAG: recombinase family protein [Clostridiaceae bacterium]|nr:recombinase family protein [Clostridiaceae bacterium]